MSPTSLRIQRSHFQEMIDHARDAYPLEACGLAAGLNCRTTAIYAIDNVLQSPTAFAMDPMQQIEAMLDIEAQGLELLAIYHSHPHGPQAPSATDVARAFYPESAYVIISLEDRAKPVARAFSILDGAISDVHLSIE